MVILLNQFFASTIVINHPYVSVSPKFFSNAYLELIQICNTSLVGFTHCLGISHTMCPSRELHTF